MRGILGEEESEKTRRDGGPRVGRGGI